MFNEWWSGLGGVTQGFFCAAAFFSVIFLWQFIMAIVGLGGEHDVDAGHDVADGEVSETSVDGGATEGHDAVETIVAFNMFSVRSILAFCMLFTWAGALYLQKGMPLWNAIIYAAIWGLGAMFVVSFALYMLRKMAESGNMRMSSALGADATVYLDIPAGGQGEVRVMLGQSLQNAKARCKDAEKILKAGTPCKVVAVRGGDVLIVE